MAHPAPLRHTGAGQENGGARMGTTPRWSDAQARAALRRLFQAALSAADPLTCLAPHLPPAPRRGRVVVVGCGKAAARMAAAVEAAWPEVPLSGLVVTTYGADL